jgi:hypothetical protein
MSPKLREQGDQQNTQWPRRVARPALALAIAWLAQHSPCTPGCPNTHTTSLGSHPKHSLHWSTRARATPRAEHPPRCNVLASSLEPSRALPHLPNVPTPIILGHFLASPPTASRHSVNDRCGKAATANLPLPAQAPLRCPVGREHYACPLSNSVALTFPPERQPFGNAGHAARRWPCLGHIQLYPSPPSSWIPICPAGVY